MARRQMCQFPFCGHFTVCLKRVGELLFRTAAPYFDEALEVQRGCDFFAEETWPEDDFFYAGIDFEEQWLVEGRTMNRLRLRRV